MTDDAAQSHATTPPGSPHQDTTTGFTSRYGLVRPRQGRYVAGVCAAIGRATNTDPVLWRVLVAVLSFVGIGVLVYLIGVLIIPAEGDTASPVESLLGRGRAGMSPITVVLLGALAVVMFGWVVSDGFRAAVLGAAVLVGGALLLNRKPGAAGQGPPPAPPTPPTPPTPPVPPTQPMPPVPPTGPVGGPTGEPPTQPMPAAPPVPPVSPAEPPYPPAPAAGPTDEPPTQPLFAPPPPMPPGAPPYPGPPQPPYPPAPPGGYRPPFAPHGPYAGAGPYPPQYGPAPQPPQPPRPPKPPKPPKQRSPLGFATFSLVFVAIGVVAALDLANVVSVSPSAYFAGVLLTTGLGLLVGAWFGRARWLIALGLVAAAAVGISTIAESEVSEIGQRGSDVYWQPTSADVIAPQYDHRFGDATLDLSHIDFTGHDKTIDVTLNAGDIDILLPPDVDVTAIVRLNAGDADVLGNRFSGIGNDTTQVHDLGEDGTGGGTLRLNLTVYVGDMEVTR
ncbi:PspC domain-containing protein [Actinomycetes bacterium KLBMP 9797]